MDRSLLILLLELITSQVCKKWVCLFLEMHVSRDKWNSVLLIFLNGALSVEKIRMWFVGTFYFNAIINE